MYYYDFMHWVGLLPFQQQNTYTLKRPFHHITNFTAVSIHKITKFINFHKMQFPVVLTICSKCSAYEFSLLDPTGDVYECWIHMVKLYKHSYRSVRSKKINCVLSATIFICCFNEEWELWEVGKCAFYKLSQSGHKLENCDTLRLIQLFTQF